jgi:hypothetical protein
VLAGRSGRGAGGHGWGGGDCGAEWHWGGWGSPGAVFAGRVGRREGCCVAVGGRGTGAGAAGSNAAGRCWAVERNDAGGVLGLREERHGWLGVRGEGGAGAAVADVDEVWVGGGRCGGLGGRGGACYLKAGVGDHR